MLLSELQTPSFINGFTTLYFVFITFATGGYAILQWARYVSLSGCCMSMARAYLKHQWSDLFIFLHKIGFALCPVLFGSSCFSSVILRIGIRIRILFFGQASSHRLQIMFKMLSKSRNNGIMIYLASILNKMGARWGVLSHKYGSDSFDILTQDRVHS